MYQRNAATSAKHVDEHHFWTSLHLNPCPGGTTGIETFGTLCGQLWPRPEQPMTSGNGGKMKGLNHFD